MAEKAIAALGQAHQMQGDTVELAAAKTGLDTGTLSQIASFGEDSAGNLFIISIGGSIFMVRPG